ncbi:hypothetical protein ARMSODRAFT_1053402 [Armillaria solidipes]|uniref:Uncharacterized protein n=1 Tax=Armillaria solidipes TaxID=1076256 RepID=A0A2H3B1M5_9AGAR|nr:hypothetical protein ARMSODRAFT_1053402 [Armillaria solidipes]
MRPSIPLRLAQALHQAYGTGGEAAGTINVGVARMKTVRMMVKIPAPTLHLHPVSFSGDHLWNENAGMSLASLAIMHSPGWTFSSDFGCHVLRSCTRYAGDGQRWQQVGLVNRNGWIEGWTRYARGKNGRRSCIMESSLLLTLSRPKLEEIYALTRQSLVEGYRFRYAARRDDESESCAVVIEER